MTTIQLSEVQQELTQYLEQLVAFKRPMMKDYHYAGMEDFLLQHGKWYEPSPLPKNIKRGINSYDLAVRKGLKYVEGIACGVIPVHHAWNVTADGKVIDSTWGDDGKAYLGVEFSAEEVFDSFKNGATLLDNWKDKWPLFKNPWTGVV